MFRRSSLLCLIALFLAACAAPQRQAATTQISAPAPVTTPLVAGPSPFLSSASAPAIFASSVIMIDAQTGQTLFEKNADQPRPVASTQKLLTALVVRSQTDLDARVTAAASDLQVEPSRLNLRPGDSYTRRELLTAMMVKSCNDVAACLARTTSGSIGAFVAGMNRKADELGATHSHFVNPHGLPTPGQYSTARDMARIAFAAYHDPVLRGMMRLPFYTFRFADGRTATLEATNKLLRRSPIFNGMKTGYTNASGRCLITSAAIPGDDVILVQLGSDTGHIFDDAERMVAWRMQQR